MEQQEKNKSRILKTKNPGFTMDHGRVPPQALDLEEVVLGALLLEPNSLNVVVDILHPEVFYKDAHKRIFSAIQRLFPSGSPIDILTVGEELRRTKEIETIGGPYYLAFLTNRVVSGANIEFHARILVQKYIQRKLIEISSEIIHDAYDEGNDVFELLNSAEDKLFKVNEQNLRRSYSAMPNILMSAREQIERAYKHQGNVVGVPSGFQALDKLTGGWQPSDLIIVAARPAMGKTAFVLSMARNMTLEYKKPVAFFSLEMSAVQLVMRIISSEAKISSDSLRKGDLTEAQWQKLGDVINDLSEAPLFIDDTAALSVFELRAKARRLKQQFDIQAIIIDYLQLMTAKIDSSGNREQEIATISRSLKALAKELNIPIITLSQLSREVEKRGGSKRPQLSDLRESGAIEQDADMVIALYRPEYYLKEGNPEMMKNDFQGADIKNLAEIIILKHRNGPIDTVNLKFISQYARFTDEESYEYNAFINEMNQIALGGRGGITIGSKMNKERSETDIYNPADDDQPF